MWGAYSHNDVSTPDGKAAQRPVRGKPSRQNRRWRENMPPRKYPEGIDPNIVDVVSCVGGMFVCVRVRACVCERERECVCVCEK
jgi:hypothetical protein